jgi:arabinogalactan endo-1,4-beta-galactosidase
MKILQTSGMALMLGLTIICLAPCREVRAQFAKGADVGWLSQMEASGWHFYGNSGVQQDALQILKDHGINSIRLRVWVNPPAGWCNKSDVVTMATRATGMGFRIMIDFHYSDSWADPGKQTKPAAWQNDSFDQLKADLYAHTYDVMNTLKANGVNPEWAQVGNETNDGMLWEDGRASTHMANFAALVSSGYDAVKAVNSSTKVIVHISNGYDNSLFRWVFDGLTSNGAKWDVIGMSLYPDPNNWSTLDSECLSNMNDMVSRYGKEVMISEVGMDVNQAAAAKDFLTDIIARTRSVSSGKGLGVFYWEPESYNGWQGYTKGAFDATGQPTIAMGAFLEAASSVANPIDDAQVFVRQHYIDFLSREPDQAGWSYWTGQITQCGADTNCIHMSASPSATPSSTSRNFRAAEPLYIVFTRRLTARVQPTHSFFQTEAR